MLDTTVATTYGAFLLGGFGAIRCVPLLASVRSLTYYLLQPLGGSGGADVHILQDVPKRSSKIKNCCKFYNRHCSVSCDLTLLAGRDYLVGSTNPMILPRHNPE
jgi:hypothetical protein